MTFVSIVPAGGAGTRLWPLSRAARPKFLLDLTGAGRSLLSETIDRLAPVSDHVLIVTGRAHEAQVRADTGADADAIIAEPSGRNSMPAIGLATAIAARRHGPHTVVGSFAADHVIANRDAFTAVVRAAIGAAADGFIATVGIAPTSPSTGFGYIELGEPLTGGARRAAAFIEKPDAQRAAQYVAGGAHVWNAGMFVMRADVLLGHLADLLPDMARRIDVLAAAWDTPGRSAALAEHWPHLDAIAIDHAIAEPVAAAGGVAVIPADGLGWDDVGDLRALARYLPASPSAYPLDADGTLVLDWRTDPGAVVTLGVPDAVVLLTDDAVLVTTMDRAQQVGTIPALLEAAGRGDLR